jgi:HSP20 family protein
MDTFDDLIRLARRLSLKAGEQVQPLRWQPAADVYRTPDGWMVKLELAGVRPDQIEVLTRGRCLIVRGRRCDSESACRGRVYSLEINYSQFERAFEFPYELENARVETQYQEGMLRVHVVPGESPFPGEAPS